MLLSLVISNSLSAEESNPRQFDASLPIKLQADTGEIDTKQGISRYSGNIKISQGKVTIEGDTLQIKSVNNKMSAAEIIGNPAKFIDLSDETHPVSAIAPTIIYTVETKTLKLINGAELKQGQNTMKGKTIDYQMDTGKVSATGSIEQNQRIEILLFPEEIKQTAND